MIITAHEWTSMDLQMSTSPGPGPQNSKQLSLQFQDWDSSSIQSMSESWPEVGSEGGRKIHGKSNMRLQTGEHIHYCTASFGI